MSTRASVTGTVEPGSSWRAWIVRRTPARWDGPTAMAPSAEARAFGLTAEERLFRACRRAGASQVAPLAPDDPVPAPSTRPGEVDVCFRADCFYDERVVAGMPAQGDKVLRVEALGAVATCTQSEALPAAVEALRAEDNPPPLRPSDAMSNPRTPTTPLRPVEIERVAPSYNAALRKSAPPFVYEARPEHARGTEDQIFSASYKGITDFVTLWVFPRPAKAVTRWLSLRGTQPNTVTAWSYLLAILTPVLFAYGLFGLGLLLGWIMTFLDTVDGKLARCTLTSTRFGHVLDHGLDLVHPPIWWLAFGWGLAGRASDFGDAALPTAIIIGGYLLGRGLEGVFLVAFKQEIFTWRPFDGFFRQIIARRNPNLVLLCAGTLAGRPDLGFLAVAVWTLACIAVHVVRIVQAFREQRAGGTIQPWANETRAAAPR